jgi:hypothetical protein
MLIPYFEPGNYLRRNGDRTEKLTKYPNLQRFLCLVESISHESATFPVAALLAFGDSLLLFPSPRRPQLTSPDSRFSITLHLRAAIKQTSTEHTRED